MLNTLLARLQQGHRTIRYPRAAPQMPDRYRGLPVLNASMCADGCDRCAQICPTQAIRSEGDSLSLDLGQCLFCTECVDACPQGAIRHSDDYRMAVRRRDELVLCDRRVTDEDRQASGARTLQLARALGEQARRLFGRSLKLRQVSAGGCNACEADVNVLNTVVFDLGRFGIQFVASPRHADGLLITGPVSRNMSLALRKTWEAIPAPRLVIAVGACAISGGPFRGSPAVLDGVPPELPVDLYIPGCPPHPLTILDGLLRLLGRVEAGQRAAPPPGEGGAALEPAPAASAGSAPTPGRGPSPESR
jgi:Ni,Fe-hydrogenase III small subunit/formate hydrogenlyase subunit 6/NADH:ubiquinone oxidoreductase subunit I